MEPAQDEGRGWRQEASRERTTRLRSWNESRGRVPGTRFNSISSSSVAAHHGIHTDIPRHPAIFSCFIIIASLIVTTTFKYFDSL